MKKLLSFLFVAIMFVACGSDSPEVVAKKQAEAVLNGDWKKAAKYICFESERDEKRFIGDGKPNQRYKKYVAEHGIKLLNTSLVSESENKATVKIASEMDGKKYEYEYTLTKIDGTWYMDYPFVAK